MKAMDAISEFFTNWYAAPVSAVAAYLAYLTGRAAIRKAQSSPAFDMLQPAVWDSVSEQRIQQLDPRIKFAAKSFLNAAAREGIFLRVTSGLRTFAEQNKLYAQGRTAPGGIVTNARGGDSWHNYGLALDVVEMKDKRTPLWSNPNWDRIGELGKRRGFEWGGDWRGFVDRPHFQKRFGKTISEMKRLA